MLISRGGSTPTTAATLQVILQTLARMWKHFVINEQLFVPEKQFYLIRLEKIKCIFQFYNLQV